MLLFSKQPIKSMMRKFVYLKQMLSQSGSQRMYPPMTPLN